MLSGHRAPSSLRYVFSLSQVLRQADGKLLLAQRFVKNSTSATMASAKSSGLTMTPPAMEMISRTMATMSSKVLLREWETIITPAA